MARATQFTLVIPDGAMAALRCACAAARVLACGGSAAYAVAMTWFRRASSWRDAECLSAALLAGVSLLAWGMPRLLPMGVRRCPLKTWTGVPCLTCGGTRAMDALLGGKMGEALRLQPLLTLLAVGALGWIIYALAGAGLRMPRLHVQFAVREKLLLVVVGCVCLAANWVYLIVDGR